MKRRFARLLVITPMLGAVLLLTPAGAVVTESTVSMYPSNLDYVVFASFADSSNWVAMSAGSARVLRR